MQFQHQKVPWVLCGPNLPARNQVIKGQQQTPALATHYRNENLFNLHINLWDVGGCCRLSSLGADTAVQFRMQGAYWGSIPAKGRVRYGRSDTAMQAQPRLHHSQEELSECPTQGQMVRHDSRLAQFLGSGSPRDGTASMRQFCAAGGSGIAGSWRLSADCIPSPWVA